MLEHARDGGVVLVLVDLDELVHLLREGVSVALREHGREQFQPPPGLFAPILAGSPDRVGKEQHPLPDRGLHVRAVRVAPRVRAVQPRLSRDVPSGTESVGRIRRIPDPLAAHVASFPLLRPFPSPNSGRLRRPGHVPCSG
jgi:hypothetical protein